METKKIIIPKAGTGKQNIMVFDYALNRIVLVTDIPRGLSGEEIEDILSDDFDINNCEWMPVNDGTAIMSSKFNDDETLTRPEPLKPCKPTPESITNDYIKSSDVVMGEYLDQEPSGDLTIGEAHRLYMECMIAANDDRFFRCIGENDCPNIQLPEGLEEYHPGKEYGPAQEQASFSSRFDVLGSKAAEKVKEKLKTLPGCIWHPTESITLHIDPDNGYMYELPVGTVRLQKDLIEVFAKSVTDEDMNDEKYWDNLNADEYFSYGGNEMAEWDSLFELFDMILYTKTEN